MTRTLTQQSDGIYIGNNLQSTDFDKVLSNFAAIRSLKGTASGLATLDANALLASAQLPVQYGNNTVVVYGNGTATANAAKLAAAYAQAKTLSPSAASRVAVLVMPGTYDFGNLDNGTTGNTPNLGMVLDTDCIDLIGMGHADNVVFISNVANQRALGCGTLRQQVQDVRIKNFTLKITAAASAYAKTGTSLDPAAYFPVNPIEGFKFTVSGVTNAPSVGSVYQDSNGVQYTVIAVNVSAGSGTISVKAPDILQPYSVGTCDGNGGLGVVTGHGTAWTSAMNGATFHVTIGTPQTATISNMNVGAQTFTMTPDIASWSSQPYSITFTAGRATPPSSGNLTKVSGLSGADATIAFSAFVAGGDDGKTIFVGGFQAVAGDLDAANASNGNQCILSSQAIQNTLHINPSALADGKTLYGKPFTVFAVAVSTGTPPAVGSIYSNNGVNWKCTSISSGEATFVGFGAPTRTGGTSISMTHVSGTGTDITGTSYPNAQNTYIGFYGDSACTAAVGMATFYASGFAGPNFGEINSLDPFSLVWNSDYVASSGVDTGSGLSGSFWYGCLKGVTALMSYPDSTTLYTIRVFGRTELEAVSIYSSDETQATSMRVGAEYSGIYRRCKAGNLAWGAASYEYPGIASGLFIECTAGHSSFGGMNRDFYSPCQSRASGYFRDCLGGDSVFGGTYGSGIFENCRGNELAFGSGYANGGHSYASGVFDRCRAKTTSYGSGAFCLHTLTVSGVSVSPTVGATYTIDNVSQVTYTVEAVSISAGSGTVTLQGYMPPVTSGTMRKASGTGDATITYSTQARAAQSFGSQYSASGPGIASGYFRDCEGEGQCFGTNLCSGAFFNCRASAAAFAANGTCSGLFVNCFATGTVFAGNGGTACGIFIGCAAWDKAFGAGGTFSGYAYGCSCSTNGFGENGTFSGTCVNCIGGAGSFGGNSSTPATGYLNGCILQEYTPRITQSFVEGVPYYDTWAWPRVAVDAPGAPSWDGIFTGKMENCTFRVTGTNKTALTVGAGAQVLNSTLIGNGSGKSVNAGSAVTAYIVNCSLNKGIGANVTNGATGTADAAGNVNNASLT